MLKQQKNGNTTHTPKVIDGRLFGEVLLPWVHIWIRRGKRLGVSSRNLWFRFWRDFGSVVWKDVRITRRPHFAFVLCKTSVHRRSN